MIDNLFFLFAIVGITAIVFWYLQNRETGHSKDGTEGDAGLLAMKRGKDDAPDAVDQDERRPGRS